MGALALVAVGCGSAGSAAGSGNVAPPAAPVAPVHSSLKRGVVFGLASTDGQKSIDIPVGTSPEIQAAQAKRLSKIQASPQVLRRELNTPSALEQRLASSDLNFSTFTTTRLKGPEPSIAYKQGSSQSAHNGITFSCSPMFAAGSHTLSAKFDFPGTGPLGVFPYLQVGDLFQSSSPNTRGAFASSQSGVTFGITTFVNGDGTGTEEITLEGGTLYSGPLLNIVPWISSFQSGLHHAKVVIDGETVVDEDFIQRGLLFKDRLPQISSGQPDNIAVQTSFGWTEDDATVDDTISVDSPRWRAALGNNTVQAAGSLSNSAWHDGNAVSFTIDNLRETLTKNLQPLTQVPIGLRAKTYESNKTLGYAVQAQALALFRYYDMTDSGSVPGFRRDAILSNFHQTPLQAKPGTPVVFEFDINAINFESGTPYVNFGLAEDPQTSEYAFFSHGELSEIDTGWHVRVPWTATQLNPPTGFLTVSVAETSDPGKSGFAELEFPVSLEQPQSDRTASVRILDVNPNPINVEESTQVTVHAQVSSSGMTNPSYSWTVYFRDENGDSLSSVSGQSAEIAVVEQLEVLKTRSTSKVTVHVVATVTDLDHPDLGDLTAMTTTASDTGTGGGGSGGGTGSSQDVVVDVRADGAPKLAVRDAKSSSKVDVAVAFHKEGTADTAEQRLERRKLLRNVVPDHSDYWEITAENLAFVSSQTGSNTLPSTVDVTVTSTVSHGSTIVQLIREPDKNLFVGSLRPGSNIVKVEPRQPDGTGPRTTNYAVAEAVVSGAENHIAQDLISKVFGRVDKFFTAPTLSLGTLAEGAANDQNDAALASRIDSQTEAPTVGTSVQANTPANDNFPHAGFEAVHVMITDRNVKPETQLTATAKVAHGADAYIVNLHGGHSGNLFVKDIGTEITQYRVGQSDLSPIPRTWAFIACDALDFRDFNGFYTDKRFPANIELDKGYPADSGLRYTSDGIPGYERSFGGKKWMTATSSPSSSAQVLLGYCGPAPATVLLSVNDQFAVQLREPLRGQHDPRIIAWLEANRKVAKTSGLSKGWLCLNACAWDKRTNCYYYIPYIPPGGVYADPTKTMRGQIEVRPPTAQVSNDPKKDPPVFIREFGIWAIPDSQNVPRILNGAWQIPPRGLGDPVQ